MKINKLVRSTFQKEYLFITGTCDLPADYFKQRIDKGVNDEKSLSYQTNVKGQRTSWDFFNQDIQFLKILIKFFDIIDENYFGAPYQLKESWGIKEGLGDYTKEHNHNAATISGVIYLNKHPQKLYFNEIDEEVLPDEGKFVLFSSILNHKTKRNHSDSHKYGLVFNCYTI